MNQIEYVTQINDLYSLSDPDYQQFDQRVDFYFHLESLLTRQLALNADVLDTLNLRNLKLNQSSVKRVHTILNLLELNSIYDAATKMTFIRALVCWEAQFSQGLEVRFFFLLASIQIIIR